MGVTSRRVGLIDAGLGNLTSVRNALVAAGGDVVTATSPAELDGVDHVVLPGVGAFGAGMGSLHRRGWVPWLQERAASAGAMLGICLGMQLLAETGTEHGATDGLGLIPGRVEPLRPGDPSARIPHIGWNDVAIVRDCRALGRVGDDPRAYYFVHSFAFVPTDPSDALAITDHGGPFVSVVGRGNVLGVQFHPEKSHRAGIDLLRAFLGTSPDEPLC